MKTRFSVVVTVKASLVSLLLSVVSNGLLNCYGSLVICLYCCTLLLDLSFGLGQLERYWAEKRLTYLYEKWLNELRN